MMGKRVTQGDVQLGAMRSFQQVRRKEPAEENMMRRVPVLASALAFLIVTTVAAQAPPRQTVLVYLPAMQSAPAPLSAPADIVLELAELPSNYALEDEAIVTNEDAAANYDDPTVALQAFCGDPTKLGKKI